MRFFIDLTCSWRERGRIAHGTLRVERGLLDALVNRSREDIAFVRFDRVRHRFIAVPRDLVLSVIRPLEKPVRRPDRRPFWRKYRIFEFGRAVELFVRRRIRDPMLRAAARVRAQPQVSVVKPTDDQSDVARFAPGDVLLIPGEMRQDAAELMKLRRAGVRLAFIFYDLLGVLPDADPRLSDRDVADLPFTDFMVREADFIFAISRYSAALLAAHLTRRGMSPRQIDVIRLSGGLDPQTPTRAVEGLAADDFVLCVGDLTTRKNQRLLISVWRELIGEIGETLPVLLLVGRIDHSVEDVTSTIRADPQVAALIRVETSISDGELAWLYANCRFSLFPSLDEGFGLPVAESLGFGKVCVASNAAAIPEAGQGLAITLDPRDANAWAQIVRDLIADDAKLRQLEQRIARAYRRVTWDETASDVLSGLGFGCHDSPQGCPPPPAAP